MNFNELFQEIAPEEVRDNVFALAGKDFFAITAGGKNHYNAMIGSGGGFGLLFKKPFAFCILRQDRYTLELMRETGTYTLSYFPEGYKEKALVLGGQSGRDSDKMRNVELTALETPSGEMTFAEARLIFACRLTQLTTPLPDDFCATEASTYIREMYKDKNEYRLYVFGEITHVWAKR